MRCASLLTLLGQVRNRDGRGVVVEVYPAAALNKWGLPFSSYKAKDEKAVKKRERIAAALRDKVGLTA